MNPPQVYMCVFITAAAAAASLQLYLTLCDPRDGSPPVYPVPGILQARTLSGLPLCMHIFFTHSSVNRHISYLASICWEL